MQNPIPYGKQEITKEDINEVVKSLDSEYLTQGPKIKEFEEEFSKYIGCKYAVAVSNGTAALHISALAVNIKPGDKVITTPITFSASANCIRYCGGEVVFVDIDPITYLLDINKVKLLLQKSPKGTYKGIIPVDFGGKATNLEEYQKLAKEYGFWLIEDSCHAPGGFFTDSNGVKQNCGNGTYADLAIFSFHPVKHITTGEGGMVTTNDENLYNKLIKLRSHGITKEVRQFVNNKQNVGGIENYPGWYMEMQELGYNYRITDFQAALGISQLKRAKKGIEKRIEIASKYYNFFKNKKYIKGLTNNTVGNAYHLFILEVEKRYELYDYLRTKNIYTQIHYIPVHIMPYYINLGWKIGDFPNAEEYYKCCISLPIFTTLTNEQQQFVIDSIDSFYE